MSTHLRVLLLCLGFISFSAFAETKEEVFEYRLHDEVTGSSLGYSRTIRGPIPFDKTYAELTAAQQARLRDDYDDLGPEDEPPFPRNGLGEMHGHLIHMLDKLPTKDPDLLGHVLVVVGVSPEGAVNSLTFYKAPVVGAMRELIAKYITDISFKPGKRNGQAVQMDYLVEANFGTCSSGTNSRSASERCK